MLARDYDVDPYGRHPGNQSRRGHRRSRSPAGRSCGKSA
jgi:hypothetical protein